jgi:hypothetical protein
MLFKFTGRYTCGHTSNTVGGVTFEGHEPTEVPDELVERFTGHPEFEQVHPLDHDGDGAKGGSLPKRRGRPPKKKETA